MSFKNPSVMNSHFSAVVPPRIQRSKFDRSHGHKTTLDEGYLVPIFCDEILPGDTMSMRGTFLGRLATPLIYPVMDNIFLDTFWFFVPARLLWVHWVNFMGEQVNLEDDVTAYVMPHMISHASDRTTFTTQSLFDYFGIPTGVDILDTDGPIALPFRGYQLIWNTWFRDENLQEPVGMTTGDGPDDNSSYTLLKRGKRKDYFTSALPWPQKGSAVTLPLGGTAPVKGDGHALGLIYDNAAHYGQLMMWTTGGVAGFTGSNNTVGKHYGDASTATISPTPTFVGVDDNASRSGLIADLSSATAATINQLRQAITIQQMLELDARGGTRYTEIIQAHFGVTPEDFRLQRPEYLGGGSQRINVSQVPQMSGSDATPGAVAPHTAQANLAAFGMVTAQSGFSKSFSEHGYVIGLANVRSDITYQEGMARFWSRRTRYDFYDPIFANLGEQAILNKEIVYHSGGANANAAFGYQERWAEYRYFPSMVTGYLRSSAAGALDSWHLATDFGGTIPSLNDSFIQDAPPITRVIAYTGSPHFILDMYFKYICARPMPVYSTPGLFRL